MKRAPKPCNAPNCRALVRDGGSRCGTCKPAQPKASGTWGSGRTSTAEHRARRERILRRDQFHCQIRYAGCEVFGHICDHIIPLAGGGADTDANTQTACGKCHGLKTGREAKFFSAEPGSMNCPWDDSRYDLKAGPPAPTQPRGGQHKARRQRGGPVTVATAPKPIIINMQ